MSTSSTAELISMAFSGQENFVPAAEEAQQERPHTFLTLAPTTSASYPLIKSTTPQSPIPLRTPNNTQTDPTPSTTTQNTLGTAPTPEAIDEILKQRRSSSLSSDGSVQKRRFLKLGPVHFGEGDGKGDWSEEVLEE